jgi:dihydrofolate synthase/folylpolyglutamate synthase
VPFREYHEAVRFLEGLNNLTQRQYIVYRRNARKVFQRYRAFLAFLGNPERGFRTVHVAGTNGKGTTAHLIHEMLRLDGRKVGSFYSPYVTTPLDSILIGGRYLAPKDFAGLIWELKDAMGRFIQKREWDAPSYFELKTTLAFLAFRRAGTAWIVLETGLGGELDATNVVPGPEAAVITNIGKDHVRVLGPRLSDIARAKAGIITKGTRRVFTSERRQELLRLFHARAKAAGADFCAVRAQKAALGQNGLLADAVAAALGVPEAARARAQNGPSLPGRFEMIAERPAVLLDSAHNHEKAQYLKKKLSALPLRKRVLVFSCAASKQGVRMLKTLSEGNAAVILTRYTNPFRQVHDLGLLYRSLPQRLRRKTAIELDPRQALVLARIKAGSRGLVVVTGSTFLVGDVRSVYIAEAEILRARDSFPLHGKRHGPHQRAHRSR